MIAAALLALAAQALPADVDRLWTGAHSACVTTQTGELWCWGLVVWDGGAHDVDALGPRKLDGWPAITQLALADEGLCAITAGQVWCRGPAYGPEPVRIGRFDRAVDVAVDHEGGCLRLRRGRVWCWTPTASQAERRYGRWRAPAMARRQEAETFGCSVSRGTIACSGASEAGQLGTSEGVRAHDPVPIALAGPAISLRADDDWTCAILADGTSTCWGPDAPPSPSPRVLRSSWSGLGTVIDRVEGRHASERFTCVLDDRGSVACHGGRFTGGPIDPIAGEMRLSPTAKPVFVDDLMPADRIAGHGPSLCTTSGTSLTCRWAGLVEPFAGWPADKLVPTREWTFALAEPAADLVAGNNHVCVLDPAGTVRCAGDNRWHQLGRTGAAHLQALAPVEGLPAIAELSAGSRHTCARDVKGGVWCWGLATSGRFGSF